MKIKLVTANAKKITIHTPFIKLDDFLKFIAVVPSGGQAKEAVQAGLVKVNGETCTLRGKKLTSGTIVEFENIKYEVTTK